MPQGIRGPFAVARTVKISSDAALPAPYQLRGDGAAVGSVEPARGGGRAGSRRFTNAQRDRGDRPLTSSPTADGDRCALPRSRRCGEIHGRPDAGVRRPGVGACAAPAACTPANTGCRRTCRLVRESRRRRRPAETRAVTWSRAIAPAFGRRRGRCWPVDPSEDYYQLAYLIPKGSDARRRAEGIEAFRARVAALRPDLADRDRGDRFHGTSQYR